MNRTLTLYTGDPHDFQSGPTGNPHDFQSGPTGNPHDGGFQDCPGGLERNPSIFC